MERIQEKMGREKFDNMNIENSRSFILYHIIKFIHPLTDKAGNDSLSPSYTQIVSQTEGRARG